MGWAEEMAGQFRQRDNRPEIKPQIGEVVSVQPLRIALQSDAVVLEVGQIYLCAALAEKQPRKASVSLETAHAALQTINENGSITGEGTITFREILAVGDLVACIPTAPIPGKAQKFILIDRVIQHVPTV